MRRHLSESDRIDGGGGTYFLPDNVSYNGRLVSVHTCFFYNDNGNKKHKKFRLRVGVFRQKGDNYLLDSNEWIDINVTRHNRKTQDCEAKNLIVPVPVLACRRQNCCAR